MICFSIIGIKRKDSRILDSEYSILYGSDIYPTPLLPLTENHVLCLNPVYALCTCSFPASCRCFSLVGLKFSSSLCTRTRRVTLDFFLFWWNNRFLKDSGWRVSKAARITKRITLTFASHALRWAAMGNKGNVVLCPAKKLLKTKHVLWCFLLDIFSSFFRQFLNGIFSIVLGT